MGRTFDLLASSFGVRSLLLGVLFLFFLLFDFFRILFKLDPDAVLNRDDPLRDPEDCERLLAGLLEDPDERNESRRERERQLGD